MVAFVRKHALAFLLIFFFCLYHSNFREQGVPGDTERLKMHCFALIDGWPKTYHDAGVGTKYAGLWAKAAPTVKPDRPPFTILPFFPIYSIYRYFNGPITLFAVDFLGKFCAVLYGLLTLLLFYGIALNLGASRARALFCMTAFGLATHVWHAVAEGLWTTSGFVPFFAAGLYFITKPKAKVQDLAWASLFLGYAVACRQQDTLLTLPFMAYLAVTRPRREWLYVLLPYALPLGGLLAWNHAVQGSILGTYGAQNYAAAQSEMRTHRPYGLTGNLFEGLAGTLFSPGRGLFFFTPVVIFPFFWLRRFIPQLKKKKFDLLKATLGSILLELLLLGKFSVWWGGYCWGPRLIASALPAFFVLFVMTFPKKPRSLTVLLLAAAIGWGTFTEGLAAYKYHHWVWNWRPQDIDAHPERVWDLKDNPVSRAIDEPFFKTDWGYYSLEY